MEHVTLIPPEFKQDQVKEPSMAIVEIVLYRSNYADALKNPGYPPTDHLKSSNDLKNQLMTHKEIT